MKRLNISKLGDQFFQGKVYSFSYFSSPEIDFEPLGVNVATVPIGNKLLVSTIDGKAEPTTPLINDEVTGPRLTSLILDTIIP